MPDRTPPPSRIVTGCGLWDGPEGTPTWVASGDADDHYRLCVLIALRARELAVDAGESIDACLDPRSRWSQRLDAVRDILAGSAWLRAERVACLYDLDALDPGREVVEALWHDRHFLRQRRELFETLLADANRGGWVLVRPRPTPEVSTRLDPDLDQDGNGAGGLGEPRDDALAELVSPDTRPILQWVRANVLPQRELELLFDATGPGEFETDLLNIVYEKLAHTTREAAKRLSCLRQPQFVNGALGPFALDGTTRRYALRAEDVGRLRETGLLQPFSPATVLLPRGARATLRVRAELSLGDEWQELHRWVGGELELQESVEAKLESHHHAVRGGSLERALATAWYYGADLRELAYGWSRDGRFREAAEVYRQLVQQFDDEDAYAWEYLAYNLARDLQDREPREAEAEEILGAYDRAFKLDRNNPLYHGRLLGFLARLGRDVEIQFHRGMERYATNYAGTSAMSFFAKPVLEGMIAGRYGKRRLEIVRRWRSALSRHERLWPLLGDGHA